MSILKRYYTWILAKKIIISDVLVILATFLTFRSAVLQSEKAELQNVLIYKLGEQTLTQSALATNSSDLVLYRSIAQLCLNNPPTNPALKGGCGSNNVLLQGAASQRDSLEGFNINASEQASSSLTNYNIIAPTYDNAIAISNGGVVLLLILSIVVNSL